MKTRKALCFNIEFIAMWKMKFLYQSFNHITIYVSMCLKFKTINETEIIPKLRNSIK